MSEFSFGTDGVRGRSGVGPLSGENVERLGMVLADWLAEQGQRQGAVVLGGDTRESCAGIGRALTRGLSRRGIGALDLGVLPTAGLALLAEDYGARCALVISASHNPAEDNGIKVFAPGGHKLGDEDSRWIEERWEAVALPTEDAPLQEPEHRFDAGERYLKRLLSVSAPPDLSGRTVAMDLANGAAHALGPELFRRMGARVVTCGDRPDGHNINADCGSLHPEGLQQLVRDQQADLGLAVDGDADRCVLVDECGELVDGDGVLAAICADLHQQGRLAGDTLVGTVMTNFGLELLLKERGLHLERTAVGDRFVSQRMRDGGFVLGGEPSGHVIFGADLAYLGDGLYTALRMADLLARHGGPLSEITGQLQVLPQRLQGVPVRRRPPLEEISGFREKLADAEERLAGQGRVVVRYSGTEPVVRVMVEGTDPGLVDQLTKELADHLATQLG